RAPGVDDRYHHAPDVRDRNRRLDPGDAFRVGNAGRPGGVARRTAAIELGAAKQVPAGDSAVAIPRLHHAAFDGRRCARRQDLRTRLNYTKPELTCRPPQSTFSIAWNRSTAN